jgi:hypothetical protein
MITGISITNFKGIRGIVNGDGELDPVDIELRPLTLLFGANSAGKSSILHALQYAAEVIERRNLDAGLIGDGAAGVDLGGYRNFVHGHHLNNDIGLGFKLGFSSHTSFPSYRHRTPRDVDEPSSLYEMPKSASVSIIISWSNLLSRPYVRRYSVDVDDMPLAQIRFEPGSRECALFLQEHHPIFVRDPEHTAFVWWPNSFEETDGDAVISQLISYSNHMHTVHAIVPTEEPYTLRFGLQKLSDAMPDFDQPLMFAADWDRADRMPMDVDSFSILEVSDYLTEAISQIVLGPGRFVRDFLKNTHFLGPIREIPQRNNSASRKQERARWSSGLGAWDHLESAEPKFIDAVSQWLGDENRLNSGYRLRLKRFKELDLADPLVVKLLTGRAFDEADSDSMIDLSQLPTHSRISIVPVDGSIELRPHDVGIGISQVVPVIVTALDGQGRFVAIEQPELHLHPKLQAELADLFIEAAKGQSENVLLLETHSELIPLRIMRRIRETFEQKRQERQGLTEDDVAIYYVESFKGETVVTRLHLSERGQLLDPWPKGFFEEGFRERFSD